MRLASDEKKRNWLYEISESSFQDLNKEMEDLLLSEGDLIRKIKSDYKYIKIETSGHIARVILNRPDQLNALSVEMMLEIEDLSRDFLNYEDIRVVIFSGQEAFFCVGMDLKDESALSENLVKRRREAELGGRMIKAIPEISQITIASIHGAALGGGACIATACDFRIASEDSFCGYPRLTWV